ncbi:MAG TPA: HD domain-containing protein [Candidatus Methanoperedens sp.]
MNEADAIALLIRSGCSSEVIEHCRIVAGLAKNIAASINECANKKGKTPGVDINAVFIGGLLHDIGRSRVQDIGHAVEGARIAVDNGLDEKIVSIIERHIGAGITKDEARELGLPARNYLPVAIEEKIVAHADNLVFGERIGSMGEVISNLKERQFDEKLIRRFVDLHNEISAMLC